MTKMLLYTPIPCYSSMAMQSSIQHSNRVALRPRREIRRKELNVYQIKSAIEIKALGSIEEYERVLHLRLECYRDAGKTPIDTTPQNMALPSDLTAAVYVLYSGRRLVGTVKITLPRAEDILESVDEKLGFYPSNFPPKENVLEVSCLCIKRGYRQTDILKLVFEQVHRSLVESSREYILISADERLQKKYRFIGFTHTGYHYNKQGSELSKLEVMISRQKLFGTYGLHADPLRWNMFLRSVTEKLIHEGKLQHSVFQKVVFRFYSCFSGVAFRLESYLLAKRVRK